MVRRVKKRDIEPEVEEEFEDPEDEEYEEPPHRRSFRKAVEEDDEDDLSIYTENTDAEYEDDDDEDEPPRRGKKSSRGKAPPPIKGGWGEFQRQRKANTQAFFPERFTPTEEETLTKFVDDEPFASYALHWFAELSGRKGFVCLKEDCPPCDNLGDSPGTKVAFNVIVFDEDGEPSNKVLICGVKLAGQLEKIANSKQGPLSRHYISISKSGNSFQTTSYVTNVVKERDVEEDWEIEPLSKTELKEFKAKAYDASVITYPSRKEMKEVVRELSDEV